MPDFKKLFLLFIVFNNFLLLSQVPVWHWAKDANSASPETLWDVSHDPTSTNVYVGGSFKGNLSSKYGPAFSSASGISDGLVAKYDVLGNVLWAFKIAGASGDEEVRGVAVDPSGNVYITGSFNSTTDFDPSASTFNLTSAGGTDGFLAKYSSAGAFLWAVKFGGANNEDSYKMAADANGIYITGSYESIPTTFYSYSSPITKTTSFTDNQINMFGAKYNSNGIAQWVVSGGSNLDDYGIKVIADASNVYFLGIYYHDISFKNATGVAGATMPDEQHNKANTYILQVTQAGNLGWQTNITTSQGGKDVIGWSIAQDAGNLYVTGQSDGNINFKYPTPALTQAVSTLNDLFLAKLSKATGTFLWNTSATGNGTGDQIGRALEVDGLGNIILGGNFNTGLNYTSVGGPNFAAGAQDIFLTGYNNAGTFLWSYKAGGAATENFNGLATDNFGNIYLAGDHGGSPTFGTVTLGAGGGTDIYLAKLGCAAVTNNTISAAQTICTGNAPSTLTGSLPTNGNLYTWEMSANSSTWTSATGTYTNQNYSPPPLTATTYYRRIATGAGCLGSPSNTLQITVTQPPSTSNAGNTQTVCVSTVTLNATAATSGTGAWSVITGTGNVTSVSNPSSQVTGLSFGSNAFVWTISNSPCASSTATVTIVRDIPPTPFAGNQQTVCAATATLAATNPTVGAGVWSVIAGPSNVTSINNPSSQVTALGTGTNAFLWTVSNGVCPTATSAVTIIRDVMPTSFAGNTQTVCASNATLAATNPTIGNGMWSVIAGPGNVTAQGDPSSQATALSTGTNTFLWTVTNGVCPTATSSVNILRDIVPASNAGNTQTVCAATATLAATNPTIGSGVWSVNTGTGNVTTITDPSSQVTGLSIGNNSFVWTVTNGVCPGVTSTVTIIRDDIPTISNAGINQTVCATTYTLNANTPSVGNGAWSVIAGTASVNTISNPASSANGVAVGQNSFVWTISNGVCPSSSSTVIVTRDDFPTASNAGSNQSVCTTTYTLNGNLPTVGTGLWSVITGTASVTTVTDPASEVTGLSDGQNNFVWTISNGMCQASSSTVSITKDDLPTISNAGSNQTICATSFTFNGNSPLIGTGTWSVVSGPASLISASSPTASSAGLGISQNQFAWIITNGTCPPSSSILLINRDEDPTTSNAGPDRKICSDQASLSGNLPSVGTGSWTLISGAGLITDPNVNNSAITNLGAGANNFVWTITNGICPSTTDNIIITQDLPPSLASAGADKEVEAPLTDLSAITPSIGTGYWSVIEGEAQITNNSNANTSVNNLSIGNNIFRWTTQNGVCPESTDDIIVYVKPLNIPNGFSPNQDGFNDTFFIPTLEFYSNVKLNVFNRWGGAVYADNDYKNNWKGTNLSNEKLADDTYYYVLEINSKFHFAGFVLIKQNK